MCVCEYPDGIDRARDSWEGKKGRCADTEIRGRENDEKYNYPIALLHIIAADIYINIQRPTE